MVEMNRVNNLNWISPMRWTFSNVNYVDDCLLKVLKGKFCTFKTTYSFTVMLLTHLLSTFIAIKLSEHRYNTLFPSLHGNWSKTDFFWGETLCLRKFSRGKFFRASTHGILRHSENFVHLYGSSPVSTCRWVFKCPASLNEFPHSLQRCGFSPVWMSKCWARFNHWIVE